MPIAKDHQKTWEIDGHKLTAEISPCSWMYPNHCLQLRVALDGNKGGCVYLRSEIRFTEASPELFAEMCAKVKLTPCKCGCGRPAFDPSSHDTNREGKCETCWTDEWKKNLEKMQAEEKKKLLRRDRSYLKKGYTHRVTATIHPYAGDDTIVDMYCKGIPTKRQIQADLKKMGSVVFDDYMVIDLATVTQ